jgi:hypothetical protein
MKQPVNNQLGRNLAKVLLYRCPSTSRTQGINKKNTKRPCPSRKDRWLQADPSYKYFQPVKKNSFRSPGANNRIQT